MGGGDQTALQKDTAFISEVTGISQQEALEMKMQSRGKGYKAYRADLAARYASFGDSPKRAGEKATALANYIFEREQPKEQDPKTKEGRSWWERTFGGDEDKKRGEAGFIDTDDEGNRYRFKGGAADNADNWELLSK